MTPGRALDRICSQDRASGKTGAPTGRPGLSRQGVRRNREPGCRTGRYRSAVPELPSDGENVMNEILHFESIKEERESYFVEYQPPVANEKFAMLNLIFPTEVLWERVKELLDEEVEHWLERYSVPLMVWAWDEKEDIIRPPNRDGDCLVAWTGADSGEVMKSWNIEDLDDFLKEAPCHPDWRTIFVDIRVRTHAEVKSEARDRLLEQKRQNRLLRIFLTLWLAVIPAGYVVFEFFGPEWLGLIGLVFVVWKALKTSLRMWNLTKASGIEEKEREKRTKMEHYFYHCERNPEGFFRLKTENFREEARERVREEAKDMRGRAGR